MSIRILCGLSIAFALSSCERVGYPTKEDMVGTWIERAPYTDTLQFTPNGHLIRHIENVTDTIVYRTDDEAGMVIFFDPTDINFMEVEYQVFQLSGSGVISLVQYRENADGIFERE